jgi:tripartite-type tricarboxylate transporter receptor subunit TctC
VIARVNRDINAALADPPLVERIETIGPIVAPGRSPEQTGEFLRGEHARWSVIAKEIGVLPE